MKDRKSKNFWEMKQADYPFQIQVAHMSPQDVDPKTFNVVTGWKPFLRVPFNGVAHWGFKDQSTLNEFKKLAEVV